MIRKILLVLFFNLLASLAILQLHNISLYPAEKGFDATGHIQYVQIIKNEKRLPLANEGWSTYHPPLYYTLSSLLPGIKPVQFMNFFTWLIFILLVYFFIVKHYKNKFFGLLGSLLAGSLPVFLYVTPMVSNEFFSGLMMSAVIIYYLIYFLNKKEKSNKESVFLGILLGLSLLSKSTAIVLLAAIFLDILIENKSRIKKILPVLSKILIIALLVSGWFYIKTAILFGSPFISNLDFPGNTVVQSPGFRDLNFFLDPTGFLKLDIFNAHYYSLWAGIYYSWFFDGHNALIPSQAFSKAGIALVISSLPLFLLSVLGFIKKLKSINKTNRLLFIYPSILFLFFIIYNFKYPFYSAVKSVYMVSAVIPWIYFVISGISVLLKNRKVTYLFALILFIYLVLIFKNFWIMDWWYDYLK